MAPPRSELPRGYAETLGAIKQRIQQERLRCSPRNLKYMRAFAAAWPDRQVVQEPLARITWYHNLALLEKLTNSEDRLWYARQALEHGWSHDILVLQVQGRARERHGKATTNFAAALPPAESDMAGQVFKDPYLFDFLGTADPRREREVEAALVDHIPGFCKSATRDEIRQHGHVLTPGRYVGAAEVEEDDEPFEEKMRRLTAALEAQFAEGARPEKPIRANLKGLGYGR